jgi:hypothetical protein
MGEEIAAAPTYSPSADMPRQWRNKGVSELFSIKDESLPGENDLRYWDAPWLSGKDVSFFQEIARTPESALSNDWVRYWCGFANGVLGEFEQMERIFDRISNDSDYHRRALFFRLKAADEQLDKQKFQAILNDGESKRLLLGYNDELRSQARLMYRAYSEIAQEAEEASDMFDAYLHYLKASRLLPDSFYVRSEILGFFLDAQSRFNRVEKLSNQGEKLVFFFQSADGKCYECSIPDSSDVHQLSPVVKYLLYLSFLSHENYFDFDNDLFLDFHSLAKLFLSKKTEPEQITKTFELTAWGNPEVNQLRDRLASPDRNQRIFALSEISKAYDEKQFQRADRVKALAEPSKVWILIRQGDLRGARRQMNRIKAETSYQELLRAYLSLAGGDTSQLSTGFTNLNNAIRKQNPNWGELVYLKAIFYDKMGYIKRAAQLRRNLAETDLTPVAAYLAATQLISDFQQKFKAGEAFDRGALLKAEELLAVPFPDDFFDGANVNFETRLASEAGFSSVATVAHRRKEALAYVLANLGKTQEAAQVLQQLPTVENEALKSAILTSAERFSALLDIKKTPLSERHITSLLKNYDQHFPSGIEAVESDAKTFITNNTELLGEVYPRFLLEYRLLRGLVLKAQQRPGADQILNENTLLRYRDRSERQVLLLLGFRLPSPPGEADNYGLWVHFENAKRFHSQDRFSDAHSEINAAIRAASGDADALEQFEFWRLKIRLDEKLKQVGKGTLQQLRRNRPSDIDRIMVDLERLTQKSKYQNDVSPLFYLGIALIIRGDSGAFNKLEDTRAFLDYQDTTWHLVDKSPEVVKFYREQSDYWIRQLQGM